MDKIKIKEKLIKECENEIAQRQARISDHKKIYDEAVIKEQDQIDYFTFRLDAYKKAQL